MQTPLKPQKIEHVLPASSPRVCRHKSRTQGLTAAQTLPKFLLGRTYFDNSSLSLARTETRTQPRFFSTWTTRIGARRGSKMQTDLQLRWPARNRPSISFKPNTLTMYFICYPHIDNQTTFGWHITSTNTSDGNLYSPRHHTSAFYIRSTYDRYDR